MIDPKIVFSPGCFDNFEGTQEELNEVMAEITQMVTSGEIFSQSQAVDDLPPEERDAIMAMLESELETNRHLH